MGDFHVSVRYSTKNGKKGLPIVRKVLESSLQVFFAQRSHIVCNMELEKNVIIRLLQKAHSKINAGGVSVAMTKLFYGQLILKRVEANLGDHYSDGSA